MKSIAAPVRQELENRRITVMHVIEDLENGGAERILINLVRGLNREKFRPLVCCLTAEGQMAAELHESGIPVLTMHKSAKVDLGHVLRLRNLMREEKVDIVHTHVFTANLWGRLAAIAAGVPVVITHEHSSFSVDDRYRRLIERVLSRRTDKIISVSEELRVRLIHEARLPLATVTTIHNGLRPPAALNDARRNQLRRTLGLERFDHLIGSVGRLEPRKNYRLLLEAMARLIRQHPSTALVLVGSGEEAASLRYRAGELGITPNVVFAGYRSDVRDLLGIMTTFCMSSNTEGISMALLEAMVAGVPVVATNVGGNPEIVPDGSYGILVPPGDAAALAEALIETLNHRDLALERARKSQKRACEFFGERRMIQRIEELYTQLLHHRRYTLRSVA